MPEGNHPQQRELKLGLALSGGGFRASLFHLGVLAKMAELDMLRHVEVISTVSGGSIVGAAYYLHVRRLLENTPPAELGQKEYIKLVDELIRSFLAGVQTNIRMRTFASLLKNLQMYSAAYSRSDRIAELYDETFYSPAFGPSPKRLIELRDIKIKPFGFEGDFSPDRDNPSRDHKVPVLLLNATVLNNGHAWRFEAVRMGEDARSSAASVAIDKNMRLLRPTSYSGIIGKQQDIAVGHAVAASACVPALFPPLSISGLYADGTRLQLVDGGVFDNQGIRGLLDRKCNLFVISDASGQLDDARDPATHAIAALGRSSSVSMNRVREEMLFGLFKQHPYKAAVIHLRSGIEPQELPYYGPDGKLSGTARLRNPDDSTLTMYDVPKNVQWLLSGLRTDLDSFTDVEAYALMEDAYRIATVELKQVAEGLYGKGWKAPAPTIWPFSDIAPWFDKATKDLLKHLRIGQLPAFKVVSLAPIRGAISSAPPIAFVLLLVGLLVKLLWPSVSPILLTPIRPLWMLLGIGFLLALAYVFYKLPELERIYKVARWLRVPSDFVLRVLFRVFPAVGAYLFIWIYLQTVNRLFLHLGKLSRLKPLSTDEAAKGTS